MKTLRTAILAASLVAVGATAATAQKKTPKKPLPKKPPVTTTVPPLDVRAGREKVEVQQANVNVFVDRLGPIAQGIEDIDAQGRNKALPPKTVDANNANKRKVVEAIRNLKSGLASLESEFRTKPALGKYLPSIQGITDLASQAEDSAIAGRFVAAKEPLRSVVKKLTDTLAVMPR